MTLWSSSHHVRSARNTGRIKPFQKKGISISQPYLYESRSSLLLSPIFCLYSYLCTLSLLHTVIAVYNGVYTLSEGIWTLKLVCQVHLVTTNAQTYLALVFILQVDVSQKKIMFYPCTQTLMLNFCHVGNITSLVMSLSIPLQILNRTRTPELFWLVTVTKLSDKVNTYFCCFTIKAVDITES